jgi:hypothetical protein
VSAAECIHGFEPGLCDTCYPKVQPERPKVVRPKRVTAKRTEPVVVVRTKMTAAEQRAFHVTHIGNLERILASGELLADARPPVDVSSDLSRELRATAEAAPGEPVSGYVPFYLDPQATLWLELRDGSADPRWSAAAREASSADFVFLITTVATLGPDVVIADGDAASTYTRFAAGDDVDRMLERLHDTDVRPDAEALAKGSVPWNAVQLIGVANEKVRDRVRAITTTKVAVYPPWFTV